MQIIYIDTEGNRDEMNLEELMDHAMLESKRAATFDVARKPEQFALLHKAVASGVAPVLFDPKMESIAERVGSYGVTPYDEKHDACSLPDEAYALFFTSGTTGVPTGAVKTKENIDTELRALKALFEGEGYERVIVTVPFIHIYGFLAGVMLPKALGCEVLFKEEYWPQELLELHEGKKTLVVTSPVYLKSLLKLRRGKAIPNVHFLSSTGLLLEDEVEAFETKYETTVLQLFGSTETGGIATKRGVTPWWTPLADVKVTANSDEVMVVDSPYLSAYTIEETLSPMPHPFTTTDIIETDGKRFRLLGRLSEIIKVSGKRISITELEHLIEKELKVKDALIRLERDSTRLKDEALSIEIAGGTKVETTDITALLKQYYPQINFHFTLKHVAAVAKNAMGKKVRR
jgi:acyl-coenzyme A synthetase/AMP-(fatty) acid ligase